MARQREFHSRGQQAPADQRVFTRVGQAAHPGACRTRGRDQQRRVDRESADFGVGRRGWVDQSSPDFWNSRTSCGTMRNRARCSSMGVIRGR